MNPLATLLIQPPDGLSTTRLLLFLLTAGLLISGAALLINFGARQTRTFLARQPVSAGATIVLTASLLLLILSVTNRFAAAVILVMGLAELIALIDHVKYESALAHFLWSDLFKAGDPARFKELVSHYIRPAIFAPFLSALAAAWVFSLLWPTIPFAQGLAGLGPRLIAGVVGLVALILFRFYGRWAGRLLRVQKPFDAHDYDRNVKQHGVLLAFLGHLSTTDCEQDQPVDYSAETASEIRQTVETIWAAANQSPASPAPDQATVRPTLIVLAFEALWDITRVPGLEFAVDPLQLMREDFGGNVMATVFAGMTSNSEFEFLTSYSMRLMHDSACPFITIDRPVPGLPAHLKQLGYRSTALHSYTRTFYDRDRVYPGMGFDQFIGLEELEQASLARQKGWYMGDEALAQPILDQLNQTRDPQLIYALTVQNHGPYQTVGRYADTELDPESTPSLDSRLHMTPGDRQAVINYTQGIRDSAKLYRAIRDACEQHSQPVILTAFGDHLPGIGDTSGYRLFQRSGMIQSVKDPALYAVPVFTWANPAARAMGLTADLNLGQTAPDFCTLAPRLLNMAGLPLNRLHKLSLLAEAERLNLNSASEASRAYAWLQYDALWGKQMIR